MTISLAALGAATAWAQSPARVLPESSNYLGVEFNTTNITAGSRIDPSITTNAPPSLPAHPHDTHGRCQLFMLDLSRSPRRPSQPPPATRSFPESRPKKPAACTGGDCPAGRAPGGGGLLPGRGVVGVTATVFWCSCVCVSGVTEAAVESTR
ncbi:uncharacterized protein BO66DRAFT_127144 [Aspergillus aculeatinus CBS 121060]|uniref:Uncharacterized protein n=1 Tax=Aspergillus aculeatinus CBS 121060 TaxID=1448322 RepID=A0ACD1H445_9EURO|nr:hypothetical protein BO66DRAFT_127144 [Aspergillus aculeatinus CBS 121060]RAH68292.1 hypothetical protein BO66DRAFT_127144 [Aspergillus aculeatinus CBS 121060]